MDKYWGLREDREEMGSKQDLKDIIKLLRFKLITSTTGTQDEFLMKKNIRNQAFGNKVDLNDFSIHCRWPIWTNCLFACICQ